MLKKVKNSVRESIYKNFRNSSKNHAEYHTLKQAITEVSETICEKKIIISQKTFRPLQTSSTQTWTLFIKDLKGAFNISNIFRK